MFKLNPPHNCMYCSNISIYDIKTIDVSLDETEVLETSFITNAVVIHTSFDFPPVSFMLFNPLDAIQSSHLFHFPTIIKPERLPFWKLS